MSCIRPSWDCAARLPLRATSVNRRWALRSSRSTRSPERWSRARLSGPRRRKAPPASPRRWACSNRGRGGTTRRAGPTASTPLRRRPWRQGALRRPRHRHRGNAARVRHRAARLSHDRPGRELLPVDRHPARLLGATAGGARGLRPARRGGEGRWHAAAAPAGDDERAGRSPLRPSRIRDRQRSHEARRQAHRLSGRGHRHHGGIPLPYWATPR